MNHRKSIGRVTTQVNNRQKYAFSKELFSPDII